MKVKFGSFHTILLFLWRSVFACSFLRIRWYPTNDVIFLWITSYKTRRDAKLLRHYVIITPGNKIETASPLSRDGRRYIALMSRDVFNVEPYWRRRQTPRNWDDADTNAMPRKGAFEAVSQFADRTSMHGVPSLIKARSRKGRWVRNASTPWFSTSISYFM